MRAPLLVGAEFITTFGTVNWLEVAAAKMLGDVGVPLKLECATSFVLDTILLEERACPQTATPSLSLAVAFARRSGFLFVIHILRWGLLPFFAAFIRSAARARDATLVNLVAHRILKMSGVGDCGVWLVGCYPVGGDAKSRWIGTATPVRIPPGGW